MGMREGDTTTLRMKKNRMNSINDHTNVIAQSLTHITNHIVEHTKTLKSITEIKELCSFLVVKYSVADIGIPSRLSPSVSVDTTWHWLLLFPSVYASACLHAYNLAAIITENDFAYNTFPRVVDHNPNTANDLTVVKEQRRRASMAEMTRLGLASIIAEEEEEIEEKTEDDTEEGTEEEGGAGEDEDCIPIKKEVDSRDTSYVNIRVKDQTGEETMFRVRNTTPFGRIIDAYASRKGVRAKDLGFLLDGDRIEPNQTIAGLDLEDDDQVDCMLIASGC